MFVENKFDAELTSKQPVDYLDALSPHPASVLAFIAPEDRIRVDNRTMLITSWRRVHDGHDTLVADRFWLAASMRLSWKEIRTWVADSAQEWLAPRKVAGRKPGEEDAGSLPRRATDPALSAVAPEDTQDRARLGPRRPGEPGEARIGVLALAGAIFWPISRIRGETHLRRDWVGPRQWPLYGLLAVLFLFLNLYAPAGPTPVQRLPAMLLILLCAAPAMAWLAGREPGRPLLPFYGGLYAAFFASPVFLRDGFLWTMGRGARLRRGPDPDPRR